MSGSTSTPKQEDVTKFLQCSLVDPKAMASEYKFNRHGDFKKLANDALAPNASPDDLEKSKAGLRESINKGRERVKIFRWAPLMLSTLISRKMMKEDSYTAPNKRTRTSKVDVRPNAPAISSVSVDKDREALSGPTSNSVQGEDRALPIVADGWKNAKMKRKRSDWCSRSYNAGGPANAKLHAPARGPRSGSMVVANTASKNGGPVGPTNRKRTQPANSSSPPITQWANRRPQKISNRFSAPVEIPKLHLATAKLYLDKTKVFAANQLDRTQGDPQIATLIHAQNLPVLPVLEIIEPHFSFPSDTDISYLKQQVILLFFNAGDIPLSQTLLSALIPEEGDDNENDGTESNGYGSAFEDETYIKSNGFMEFSGVGNFYGYGKKPARGFHNEPVCSVSDYHTMSMDNRLLLELESGLCPKLMVGALFSNTLVGLGHGSKRGIKQDSVDEHTKWSAGTKLAKKEALANVKQTLERCQEFETTGNSFKDNVEDEPPLYFSHLEIPEMDVLGDAFSEKSQELGSWLNIIDDIILQDDEFMGLEIPMDDLSDIKMTV
ncbi:hypothetical protein Tco_1406837 [Tanacetum coccineum]